MVHSKRKSGKGVGERLKPSKPVAFYFGNEKAPNTKVVYFKGFGVLKSPDELPKFMML